MVASDSATTRRRGWLHSTGTLLLVAAVACGGDGSVAPVDPSDRGAVFDAYWSAFDRTYPMFPLKGVDWNAARTQYRSRAVGATSTAELVEVLREMTAPLRDVHTGFVAPNGQYVATWTPSAEVNWDREQWRTAMRDAGFVQVKPNFGHATFPSGIAYIVLGSWNSTQFTAADVDPILDRFRDAPGLILDVRANGGGSDAIAFGVAGRFLTQRRTAGSVRTRNGGGHGDLGAATAINVSPRGARLTMPVVVLTGRGVFSSSEEFVDVLRQEPGVLTVGDTTGGGSGNPEERPLTDGWRYRVPRWLHLASDGAPIEGRGIAPERYVAWDAAAARRGRDVVLEAAIALLGGPTTSTGVAPRARVRASEAPRAGPAPAVGSRPAASRSSG